MTHINVSKLNIIGSDNGLSPERRQVIIWTNAGIQSTPVISRLLGAKIRERELSGSPVISRCRAKATTREFRITDPDTQAFSTLEQYVER